MSWLSGQCISIRQVCALRSTVHWYSQLAVRAQAQGVLESMMTVRFWDPTILFHSKWYLVLRWPSVTPLAPDICFDGSRCRR